MSEYIIKAADWAIDYKGESLFKGCKKIVRCCDCVYFDKYENDEISVCYRFDNEQPIVEPDGFCAWGERKERIEK